MLGGLLKHVLFFLTLFWCDPILVIHISAPLLKPETSRVKWKYYTALMCTIYKYISIYFFYIYTFFLNLYFIYTHIITYIHYIHFLQYVCVHVYIYTDMCTCVLDRWVVHCSSLS